jgi:hypothetical protein
MPDSNILGRTTCGSVGDNTNTTIDRWKLLSKNRTGWTASRFHHIRAIIARFGTAGLNYFSSISCHEGVVTVIPTVHTGLLLYQSQDLFFPIDW